MYEYKVICEFPSQPEFEEEINALAKEGYVIDVFSTTEGMSVVIMKRKIS